jgi:hypothetical protein
MHQVAAALLNLTPVGETFGSAPETKLKGNLEIAGLACHVEAFQVTNEPDGPVAVSPEFTEQVEILAEFAGGQPMTTTIDDRQYVLCVSPYTR